MPTIRITRDRKVPEARSRGQIQQTVKLQRENPAEGNSRNSYTLNHSMSVSSVDISGLDDLAWSGRTATDTIDSGQTVAVGSVLWRVSDAELELADLSKGILSNEVFLSLGTDVGAQPVLLPGGSIRNSAWSFTAGQPVYLDPATPGALTQTNPGATEFSRYLRIGHAVTTDILYFERVSMPGSVSEEQTFLEVLNPGHYIRKVVYHNPYLYAFTDSNHIYRSGDGIVWAEISFTGMTAFTVRDAISQGSYLYLAGAFTVSGVAKKGVVRSTDGQAYSLVADVGPYEPYSIFFDNINSIFFAGSNTGGGAGNCRVFSSSDGETWATAYSGNANWVNVLGFAVDASYLYAALEYSTGAAIFKSSNDGATWTAHGAVDTDSTNATGIWCVGTKLFYLGSHGYVWSYEYDPVTASTLWVKKKDFGLAVYTALISTMSGDPKIYMSSGGKVYWTRDLVSYVAIDGPTNKFIASTMAEFGGSIYAGSIQSGSYKVWRLSKALALSVL